MAFPKLTNNPFDIPTFQYPLDLGSVGQEPYMVFQVRDPVAHGAKAKGTVAMYMPPDVRVNYGIDYEMEQSVIDQTLASADLIRAYFGSDDTLTQKVAKGLNDFGVWAGAATTDAATSVNARAFLERTEGKIINPHMGVYFRGVQARSFDFSFQMFAKNAKESEQIQNIIHVFKYSMHPSTGPGVGKRFFLYPDNFLIGLFSPADDYLFKISVCVLENMEVDYAGSKTPAFFYDTGAPVHVSMNLKFREMEIMTKERIEQGY